jgi:hypothetical protein
MLRQVRHVGFLLLAALLGWWGRGLTDNKKGVNNMHSCRCEELKRELHLKQVRTHLHKYFLPVRPTLP